VLYGHSFSKVGKDARSFYISFYQNYSHSPAGKDYNIIVIQGLSLRFGLASNLFYERVGASI